MVDVLLQDRRDLEITFRAGLIPQELVPVLQPPIFRHHLLENTILAALYADVCAGWLNAIGCIAELARAFAGHEGHEGGVPYAVLACRGTEVIPGHAFAMRNELVDLLLPGVNWHDALCVLGVAGSVAGSLFACQIDRRLDQIIAPCFGILVDHFQGRIVAVLETVLGQPVGKIDDSDTKRTIEIRVLLCRKNRIVLIAQQGIKTANGQGAWLFKILGFPDLSPVDGRQCAKGYEAIGVVEILQGPCGQRDLGTKVALPDRGNRLNEARVRVGMVDVHQVDATRVLALLHEHGKQIYGLDGLLADLRVALGGLVKLLEPVLVGKK